MINYDRYICTTLHKRHMLPGPTPEERDKLAAEGKRIRMEHVLWIDDEVIPGAYYGESTWIWPESYPNRRHFAYGEVDASRALFGRELCRMIWIV